MLRYLFDARDSCAEVDFKTTDTYLAHCSGFHSVLLTSEDELTLLFELLGFRQVIKRSLVSSEAFDQSYDLSEHRYPVFDLADYDNFYQAWLDKTGRQGSMAEYGQLVFIQGQAEVWNKLRYRLVLHERA